MQLVKQGGKTPVSGKVGQSPYCLLEGLHLITQVIPGVQPQGPYAQGFTEDDAPSKTIPTASFFCCSLLVLCILAFAITLGGRGVQQTPISLQSKHI